MPSLTEKQKCCATEGYLIFNQKYEETEFENDW